MTANDKAVRFDYFDDDEVMPPVPLRMERIKSKSVDFRAQSSKSIQSNYLNVQESKGNI